MNPSIYWRHSSKLLGCAFHMTVADNQPLYENVELRIRATVTSTSKGLVQGARQ